ncbi:MAG: response regulator transcription factor [Vampirovibrionales bacterium]|nr:response regulator transcription factor [Vampirovibrionales bacterium]
MSAIQKTIHVVIIEDYRLIRIGIRCDLERYDFVEVIGDFETAESALEFIQKNKPDVVIMDLGLPGIDGIEATRRIKKIDASIKVMVLTSHESQEEVVSAFGASANAYCLKSIEPARFIEVLKMVADGAAWLDPEVAKVALDVFYTANTAHPQGQSLVQVKLSEREREILKLIAEGKSNTEIATCVNLSVHTVKSYVSSIFQKLEVSDRVQASVKAIQEGYLH